MVIEMIIVNQVVMYKGVSIVLSPAVYNTKIITYQPGIVLMVPGDYTSCSVKLNDVPACGVDGIINDLIVETTDSQCPSRNASQVICMVYQVIYHLIILTTEGDSCTC